MKSIQEVSVCDIAGKVACEAAVLDGVVDGPEFLSNSSLDEGKMSPANFDGVVRIWKENWVGWGSSIGTKLVGDSKGGFWSSRNEESIARVVGMTGGVGCDGRTGDVHLECKAVLVHPRLEITKEEGGILWEVVLRDFEGVAGWP
jgi:hypothetical protein